MGRTAKYKCCICHKELNNTDTIRLAKQLYGLSYSGGHTTVEKNDFCEKCYSKYAAWLKKHKEK